MVLLRPYEAADLADIVAIERDCFPDAWREQDFVDWLAEPDCAATVAVKDGKVVAFLVFQRKRKRIGIIDIAVSPLARHLGIARQLIDSLASQSGCRKIELEVPQTNVGAQMAYLKCDFIVTGLKRRDYPDGEHAVHMTRYVAG